MDPEQLNVVGVETRWGYKTFHLYGGDVTRLDVPLDVLVLSVYEGDYSPLDGTVVRAVEDRFGISVGTLASDPEWDLRPSFGCWISKKTNVPTVDRVLCVELGGEPSTVPESIQNMFVALGAMEGKGAPIRHVAAPLLGAGSLGLDPDLMIRSLLKWSLEFMRRSPSLERIYFVELHPERAKLLDSGMNSALGRDKVVLPKGELIRSLASEFTATLDRAMSQQETAEVSLLELRRVIGSEQLQGFEVGVALRRLAELMVRDLASGNGGRSLHGAIESLHNQGVAKWIISYLHVLRVFGNESAHESQGGRIPPQIDEADLAIALFCANRTLGFWLDQAGG